MEGLDGCCAQLEHPGVAATFTLRRLDVERDLALLHTWMNDPQVARFWKKAWPRPEIEAYLRDQDRSAHSTPYLGAIDGAPMSYWELYRADLDPLAGHYPAREHDVGLHVLLGPGRWRGRGLAPTLLRTVATWQLQNDPAATRVVGEPDAGNARILHTLRRAGFHHAMDLDLPTKRAALMVFDRDPRRPAQTPPPTPDKLC
ncbi:GNAT family N-acetyltransferase [Mycolicibacillus koreensis]|nr:GNAT family N-acetyltransferase [Mycolicibacillus koreensis]